MFNLSPMRLLLFASAMLALAACTTDAHLPPEQVHDAARAAIEAGDAAQATRLYKTAARNGDLHAMADLALAYQRGYYRRGAVLHGRPGARHLATRQSDLQSRRWMNRYLETVRRPSDDPMHRHLLALDLLNGQRPPDSAWQLRRNWSGEHATPAKRDSAIAILDNLLASGQPGVAFALANTTDDREQKIAYFQTAAAHGDVQACFWAAMKSTDQWRSSAGMAAYLDARAPCEAMPGAERVDFSNPLDALREQAALGNPASIAMMDSLVVLGAVPDA
ncbi:MAG: hypothetical protein Rubg2KO_37070 [Rubricoccaceae bacterium]